MLKKCPSLGLGTAKPRVIETGRRGYDDSADRGGGFRGGNIGGIIASSVGGLRAIPPRRQNRLSVKLMPIKEEKV